MARRWLEHASSIFSNFYYLNLERNYRDEVWVYICQCSHLPFSRNFLINSYNPKQGSIHLLASH